MKRSALCLMLLLLVGCGDDNPVRPTPPAPFQYPAPNSPQNAVLIYEYAWQRRDSVQIRAILDETYLGRSEDLTDASSLTFYKDDEVQTVANMARDSALIYVSVDLRHPSTWIRFRYELDPKGWAAIQIPMSEVTVDGLSSGSFVAQPQFMEFKLQPTPPTPGAGYDTTWTIVRWTEIRTGI